MRIKRHCMESRGSRLSDVRGANGWTSLIWDTGSGTDMQPRRCLQYEVRLHVRADMLDGLTRGPDSEMRLSVEVGNKCN